MNSEIPNIDDMDRMAKISTTAKAKLEDLKNELEQKIAHCIKEALINKDYYINGKAPTASYCSLVVTARGNTETDFAEISRLKSEIVEQERIYQEAKLLLGNMKDRVSIWQTSSANNRKVLI
jgi:hypothetical protein